MFCCWILSFDLCFKILRQMAPGKLMLDRENLARRVLELEQERAALQATLATRDAELTTRDAELAARDAELAARTAELAERTTEVDTLRTQLEYSETERWNFFEQLLDAHLALEGNGAAALQATLDERDAQLAAANEENYVLSGQVDALLEEKDELDVTLLEAQGARDALEGDLQNAQATIAHNNATIEHLQAANDALHAILNGGPPEPLEIIPPEEDVEMSDGEDVSDVEDGAPPSPMRDDADYYGDDDE